MLNSDLALTIQQLRDEGYKAFYIAIGARGGRMAGVPGEDAKGVMSGIEFLNKVNKDEEHREYIYTTNYNHSS